MELMQNRSDWLSDTVQTAIAVGVFDGVHTGHRKVLEQVKTDAARLKVASCVVTFDIHPAHIVRPENAPKLLTTIEQKLELLESVGLDYVYMVEFDDVCADTRPETFVEQVLVNELHAKVVVVGEDFHFGKGRSGNVALLKHVGVQWGFDVVPLKLIRHHSNAVEPVSSTAIRRTLAGGDVARAARMLGRPYEVRGVVVEGDKRGVTVGFPTANVPVPQIMAWPADAVYAGFCVLPDGTRYVCAINIGRRPTFYEHSQKSLLEVHLLDFSGDLYGCEIKVEFIEFLRSERKFEGIGQLSEQLKIDVTKTRNIMSTLL